MFTQSDILNDLDSAGISNPCKFFPRYGGDEMTIEVSSNAIHLYADDFRWAIAFETNGYSTPGGCIETQLTYFGNCLVNLDKLGMHGQHTCNTKFIANIIDSNDLKNIETEFERVSPNAEFIIIKGNPFPIEHDLSKYKEKDIEIFNYDNPNNLIDFTSLTRYLNDMYPDLFNATEDELKICLPNDLPKLMTINKWHHREYNIVEEYPIPEEGSKPSEYETFQLIANVLVYKNINDWKPTLKPNNNWRNWIKY